MILVINESTFLLNQLQKQKKIMFDNVKFVSTKGFLFDYIIQDNKLTAKVKDPLLISFLKNFDKERVLVIVATDLDPAGHLISTELLSVFKKAAVIRFQQPFESLFKVPSEHIVDYLKRNSMDKFYIGASNIYLKTRFYDKDFNKKRINTLAALKQGAKVKKIKTR